ncbi:MAG: hypothetical protein ACR2LC_16040 [Pyrinomonadaceae bacterium]
MKGKLLVALVLAVIVGAIGVVSAISNNAAKAASNGATSKVKTLTNTTKQAPQEQPADPEGVIDGATHPEKISDQLAYTLLFRFLSGRNTEAEKNRARSYLKYALGCSNCGAKTAFPQPDSAGKGQIDALLSVAADFEQRVGAFDRLAKNIKDQHKFKLDENDRANLKALQKQKEAIVSELVDSLPTRLGTANAEKIRRHINEEIKPKVKISPALNSSPTAPTNNSAT